MAANPRKPLLLLLLILLVQSSFEQSDPNGTVQPSTTSTSAPPVVTTLSTTTRVVPTGTPSPLPKNTDLGPCTCDLTHNSCDVNCCCDEDCSAADRQAFSQCIETLTRINSNMCIKKSVIIIDNTPYEKNTTNPDLFCIVLDNYKDRNYYTVPESVTTLQKFNEYKKKYGGRSYKPQGSQASVADRNIYKSGDAIYTLFESNVLGRLGLPRSLTTNKCFDGNLAAFLYDESYECVRELEDLASGCQTDLAIDAHTYFSKFKVVASPEFFKRVNITGDGSVSSNITANTTEAPPTPLHNSSSLVEIVPQFPMLCLDDIGIVAPCNFTGNIIPSPTYDNSTGKCSNTVLRVQYSVSHNSTQGITAVGVRFLFAAVTSKHLPLSQQFTIGFSKFDESDAFERSGNPGYVVGQPILAGKLQQYEDPDGNIKQAIELNTDRSNWLTIVTSSATGKCITEPNNRVPVNFGENLRSGCTFRVSYANITNVCQLIQAAAINALLGDAPTYAATFGNSQVEKVEDWAPILIQNQPPGTTGSNSQKKCFNMVLGLHIEVVYANVGSLANPQPKILGVSFIYDQPQDITYQCVAEYCRPGAENLTQMFEVSSSVDFIDATQRATPIIAERPQMSAKLPYDFFYPFYYSAAPQSQIPSITTLLGSAIFVHIIYHLSR